MDTETETSVMNLLSGVSRGLWVLQEILQQRAERVFLIVQWTLRFPQGCWFALPGLELRSSPHA